MSTERGSGLRVSLSLRGDYAVRTMLALGRAAEGEVLSAARIAAEWDIPVRFAAHVLTDLRRAGLIHGHAGRSGGYSLAIPAIAINLLQIVDAVEDRGDVHDAFSAATEALRAQLATTTLAELANRR
jgi:Rrf2 family protein